MESPFRAAAQRRAVDKVECPAAPRAPAAQIRGRAPAERGNPSERRVGAPAACVSRGDGGGRPGGCFPAEHRLSTACGPARRGAARSAAGRVSSSSGSVGHGGSAAAQSTRAASARCFESGPAVAARFCPAAGRRAAGSPGRGVPRTREGAVCLSCALEPRVGFPAACLATAGLVAACRGAVRRRGGRRHCFAAATDARASAASAAARPRSDRRCGHGRAGGGAAHAGSVASAARPRACSCGALGWRRAASCRSGRPSPRIRATPSGRSTRSRGSPEVRARATTRWRWAGASASQQPRVRWRAPGKHSTSARQLRERAGERHPSFVAPARFRLHQHRSRRNDERTTVVGAAGGPRRHRGDEDSRRGQ